MICLPRQARNPKITNEFKALATRHTSKSLNKFYLVGAFGV
jgi:hypothetical protein